MPAKDLAEARRRETLARGGPRSIIQKAVESFDTWADGKCERAVYLYSTYRTQAGCEFMTDETMWSVFSWIEKEATGHWPTVPALVEENRKKAPKRGSAVPVTMTRRNRDTKLDDWVPKQKYLLNVAKFVLWLGDQGSN